MAGIFLKQHRVVAIQSIDMVTTIITPEGSQKDMNVSTSILPDTDSKSMLSRKSYSARCFASRSFLDRELKHPQRMEVRLNASQHFNRR